MSTRTSQTLKAFYDAMFEAFGPQRWWPAKSPTEVIIGAILTQNTAWRNVERAIANLAAAKTLDWRRLHEMTVEELAELVRPAGTYKVKARRLKSFVEWLWDRYQGDLKRMFNTSSDALREQLLSVSGIGRETADAILLYAGGVPSFVVDAYTARILYRHGLVDDSADYDEIKDLFESNLPEDAAYFNEYHALLVQVGKLHCRPCPRCEGCPLERFEHEDLTRRSSRDE
ncbi:MAG TPA: endonuclease III domain-containing protein [Phycisphaerae bacterium]|nr:endonuclease III domain-containing protein [Phycisphaerae bacterium]HRY68758.1 endonuclease III domain-containing protein [Phycisphaerae bacterium]HSA28919.1 endonuclease III domain-containing protein [Phycisphaerae bacterium]